MQNDAKVIHKTGTQIRAGIYNFFNAWMMKNLGKWYYEMESFTFCPPS